MTAPFQTPSIPRTGPRPDSAARKRRDSGLSGLSGLGRLRSLALGLALAGLAACSAPTPSVEPDQPVHQLYNTGMSLLQQGRTAGAVRFFDEVERQHPYSAWSARAILMSAYAHYLVAEHDRSIAALDRFIRLHPGSPDIAYAYYLRALNYYEQIADIERDQAITRLAMEALDQVVRRFPDTPYGRDARLKYDLTVDQIAGQHVSIGRWYQRQNQHIAAIRRFRTVIESYQTTSHVPEALHRLTESYLAIGLTGEATRAASVLGHNFPDSAWYLDSYVLMTGIDRETLNRQTGLQDGEDAGRRSWLGRAWNTIF